MKIDFSCATRKDSPDYLMATPEGELYALCSTYHSNFEELVATQTTSKQYKGDAKNPFNIIHLSFDVIANQVVTKEFMYIEGINVVIEEQKELVFESPLFYYNAFPSTKETFVPLTKMDTNYFETRQRELTELSLRVYKEMLKSNIAKELAIAILPISLSTSFLATASLTNWIDYIKGNHIYGQSLVHKELAIDVKQTFIKHFPILSNILNY